jgi:hypothetical protein
MGRSSAEISREKRGHELRSLKDEMIAECAAALTRGDVGFPDKDPHAFSSEAEARAAFHRHAESGLGGILARAEMQRRARGDD